MVANKKVLPLLPKGANVNRLTYGQVTSGRRQSRTSYGARLGFPAGPNGLIHRFFQGYLVPAFSGGVVTTFKQRRGRCGWLYMKDSGGTCTRSRSRTAFMQDPLLTEEVLLAWEHVARLTNALLSAPGRVRRLPGADRAEGARATCPCSPASRSRSRRRTRRARRR